MKDREKRDGRRHFGIRRAAVLGACLAAMAGAQPATTLDADMQRAYAQAGRVGGSVGIARPENQLQVKDSMAAFVTADSLFVQPLRAACTLPVCGWVCAGQAKATYAFPLPPGRDGAIPPMGLLRVHRPGAGTFTAVLAMALPGNAMHRIEVMVDAQGRSGFRIGPALILAGLPANGIRAFADLQATSGGATAGFLALGREGALRRIEETSGGLIEIALNSGTRNDFLSQGEGWVGTAQGRIWRLRSGLVPPYLEQVQAPAPGQPIDRIDDHIARIGSDRYLVNRGTHWTGPQPPVPGLLGVIPRWRENTTWLELLQANRVDLRRLEPQEENLRYRRDGGPWTAGSVEPPRYEGEGKWVYEISLRDPDRNLRAPHIGFAYTDMIFPRFLEGVQADPEVGCAATGWCLPGDEAVITLTLGPDSVSLSMPVLEGRREIDPMCKTPVFVGARKTLTLSEPWDRGNWILIEKGSPDPGGRHRLHFAYGNISGVRPAGAPKAMAEPARRGPGMRLVWEAGAGEAVDAGGRRITARAGSSEPRPVPR